MLYYKHPWQQRGYCVAHELMIRRGLYIDLYQTLYPPLSWYYPWSIHCQPSSGSHRRRTLVSVVSNPLLSPCWWALHTQQCTSWSSPCPQTLVRPAPLRGLSADHLFRHCPHDAQTPLHCQLPEMSTLHLQYLVLPVWLVSEPYWGFPDFSASIIPPLTSYSHVDDLSPVALVGRRRGGACKEGGRERVDELLLRFYRQ